jgi:hypothetical protein
VGEVHINVPSGDFLGYRLAQSSRTLRGQAPEVRYPQYNDLISPIRCGLGLYAASKPGIASDGPRAEKLLSRYRGLPCGDGSADNVAAAPPTRTGSMTTRPRRSGRTGVAGRWVMGEFGALGFWLFLAAIVAGSITLAVGMITLADRILSDSVGQKQNSALSPFLTCVALVFGALLGFTVVVAWEQFSSAEAHVTHEASTLTTMYRQTVAMPVPEQAQLRRLLRQYADAVKGPEWDRQDEGGTSNTARAAITQMYRVLGSQQPNDASSQIKGEFVGQLTVLVSDRNQRFLDTRPRIPGVLWSALLFGAVVVVGICGFMRLDSRHGHVLLSSAVAVLLGLLLFLVFWLDHPFGTQRGITSQPFEQALTVFDAVDQGT